MALGDLSADQLSLLTRRKGTQGGRGRERGGQRLVVGDRGVCGRVWESFAVCASDVTLFACAASKRGRGKRRWREVGSGESPELAGPTSPLRASSASAGHPPPLCTETARRRKRTMRTCRRKKGNHRSVTLTDEQRERELGRPSSPLWESTEEWLRSRRRTLFVACFHSDQLTKSKAGAVR
jgi:hypothetical protein